MKWSGNDNYSTPEYFRKCLDDEFGFDLDPCPLDESPLIDGLVLPWTGNRVFVNPPWSVITPWVQKALKRDAEIVVMVLPARTDTDWFHSLKDNGAELRLFRKRVNFHRNGEQTQASPTDGTLVAIIRKCVGNSN